MTTFRKIPLAEAIEPKEGLCMVYTNRYWLTTVDGCILVYGRGESPQCNASRAICESIKVSDERLLGERLDVELIPLVMLRAKASDFW